MGGKKRNPEVMKKYKSQMRGPDGKCKAACNHTSIWGRFRAFNKSGSDESHTKPLQLGNDQVAKFVPAIVFCRPRFYLIPWLPLKLK